MEKQLVLEAVLKRFSSNLAVSHILDVQVEPVVAKGENYASTILRIKMKVVLGNGKLAKRSIILKKALPNAAMNELSKECCLFKTEIMMYTTVLKEIENLMETFEDTDEPLWCNLIYWKPYSILLLEDLKLQGYRTVKRQEGLDLEHGILALRALAKFHGICKVLEEQGFVFKEDYVVDEEIEEKYLKAEDYAALQNTVNGIKHFWGPSWKKVVDKMNMPFEVFSENMRRLLKSKESDFMVLNHGDMWCNNIMFKYDWNERPISIKFLDFQLANYGSSCLDVTSILFFGLKPQVRQQNYNTLMNYYHESLVQTLNKFQYAGPKPSLEQIRTTMKRLSYYGQFMFAIWYPIVCCESKEALNMEKLLETNGKQGFNYEIFKEEQLKEKMTPDLMYFFENYLNSSEFDDYTVIDSKK